LLENAEKIIGSWNHKLHVFDRVLYRLRVALEDLDVTSCNFAVLIEMKAY
jgi:hypothetical protein